MVERHRDESVPLAGSDMVVEGLGQPVDQPRPLIIFVAVLETDNGIPHLPLGAIAGSRPLEMPGSISTVGATESCVMAFQGRIRITALPAKRRFDPDRLGFRDLRPGEGQIQRAFAPVPREGIGAASGEMEG